MRLRAIGIVTVFLAAMPLLHPRLAHAQDPMADASSSSGSGPGALSDLPRAQIQVDSRRKEIVIELPSIDVLPGAPKQEAMALTPICRVEVPVSGSLYRYRVEVVDSAGHPASGVMLHHFNLTDPGHRELFLPISLHLLAASRETPAIKVPRLLLGMPVRRGQLLIAGAMLANASPTAAHDVRVRLVLGYTPAGRLWPFHHAYPFVLDVLFPLGHPPAGSKALDLPPGRTVRSWEARPTVPGTILGVGGHLHDYGVALELTDVTAHKVLWHGTPVTDAAHDVLVMPVAHFYNLRRMGLHITPRHVYRVTAVYENPTGHRLCDAAMGAVAGLFIPDPGVRWPTVDTTDAAYRQDLHDTLENDPHDMMAMMVMDHPCDE